ncbi:MAG TPA: hypothetical protein VGV37_06410 [Aliidongia sp.]|uniref:hypothetical protein n=1 Tax=Aliidongia sp. TaxID=1914230 RepID=UPI002DDCC547|nr:hypothetical protein [Aliidongia sp.]HEV2674158.1 hypothetical protein [Aliidongia sp.]
MVADVANQALDAAGVAFTIADLEEGTHQAQVTLRAYGQCLRQLFRSAHWSFARKEAPMLLLADATGQTPDFPTKVIFPWSYSYALPTDCMKARFVPMNRNGQGAGNPSGNFQIPNTPLTTGGGLNPHVGRQLIPSRFLVATDFNNLPPGGAQNYDTPGVSPTSRTVILSNVRNAELVYTAFLPYPTVWDPEFRAAFVAYLASEIALPLAADKKFGMAMRDSQIRIAREKIIQARITDGNEGFASTTDHTPDWMSVRSTGGGWNSNGAGWGGGSFGDIGVLGLGWDSCGFSSGESF